MKRVKLNNNYWLQFLGIDPIQWKLFETTPDISGSEIVGLATRDYPGDKMILNP